MPYRYNAINGQLDIIQLGGGAGGGINQLDGDSGVGATNATITIAGGTNISTVSAAGSVTVNFSGILPVASGGTGASSLTDGGIILGSGAGAVTVTAQPTNGQLLIGSTGVDPVLATLTGTANEIDVTNGAGSITLTLSDTVDLGDHTSFEVPNGAAPTVNAAGEIAVDTTVTDLTGLFLYHDGTEVLGAVAMPIAQFTSPTDGYVPAYNATNDEFELVANASGGIDVLAGDSGTATGSTVNIVGGEGIDVTAATDTVTVAGEDATDANKGIASFVAADFSVSSGAVSLVDTVVKTVATDSGSATPSSHGFTIAGAGAVSTSGSGDTVTVMVAGITEWVEETTTSRALSVNEGVIGNNAATITMTLPAVASLGDKVRFVQKGAGAVAIAQNAGQTVHFGNSDSTAGAGGSVTSSNQWDSLELVCTTANTDWAVLSSQGSWVIV